MLILLYCNKSAKIDNQLNWSQESSNRLTTYYFKADFHKHMLLEQSALENCMI